ncbi:MAG: hypothetical protein AAF192_04110 [Pseudomonadota bacterium]
MTLVICLILIVPLGVWLPKLIVGRMPSGLGVLLGAGAAMAAGAAIAYGLGFLVASATGSNAVDEINAAFNAWKLLIFLAPAAGLHYRRQAAKAEEGE